MQKACDPQVTPPGSINGLFGFTAPPAAAATAAATTTTRLVLLVFSSQQFPSPAIIDDAPF